MKAIVGPPIAIVFLCCEKAMAMVNYKSNR